MREMLERFRVEAEGRTGLRYSQELRGLGRQFGEQVLASGGSRRQAASELGVSDATLARWLRGVGPGASGELCEVVVAPRSTASASVVLISPSGWRVEGLALREAAELLAALS